MFARAVVIAFGCSAVMLGCGTEPQQDSAAEIQEIVDNLKLAGFPDNEIELVDDQVIVGRDAVVGLEASREMIEVDDSSTDEQYRTTNTVNRTLRRVCINAVGFSGVFGQALNRAIANYTDRNFTFNLFRNPPPNGCQFTIRAVIQPGLVGGSAGFPSGGNPFNQITIGGGLASFPVSTIEHVITHELGHCFGLRHSDFFNRSISCGSGGDEGQAGVGAIHIPGTPTGASVGGSIMNSCFRTNETGNFTASDVTALRFLYLR